MSFTAHLLHIYYILGSVPSPVNIILNKIYVLPVFLYHSELSAATYNKNPITHTHTHRVLH